MDLRSWLVDELDDTAARLKAQVLFLVPEERRSERPGGGNSIMWACYHAARHADLALSVLTGSDVLLPVADRRGGGGLDEEEATWSSELDPRVVDDYLAEVLVTARSYLSSVELGDLNRVPDTLDGLARAGVPADAYDWLTRMWSAKPASYLLRWPIMGHMGNHVGEMIATRNRMGLSPF